MRLIALLKQAPGWLIPLCLALQAAAFPAEELAAAIAAGRVRASFAATGGSSGDAMRVTVRKLAAGDEALPLTIPPGTRLKSGRADEQDMYIAGVRGVEVSDEAFAEATAIEADATPRTYILDAYCAEMEKDNPSADGQYALGSVNPIVACILAWADHLSVAARQAAVWIHTDKASFEQVDEKIPIKKSDWKAAMALARQCEKAGR